MIKNWRTRIMCFLTWGKIRRHYEKKRKKIDYRFFRYAADNDDTLKKIHQVLLHLKEDITLHKRKIRVVFLTHEPAQCAFLSLYEAMMEDGSFDIEVRATEALHPFEELQSFYLKYGITIHDAWSRQNDLPDILFYHAHYFSEEFYNIIRVFQKCLCVDLNYSYFLSNSSSFAQDISCKFFWKRYVATPLCQTRAQAHVKNDIVLSGRSKMDEFYRATPNPQLWKNPDAIHIIYAPHYSINCHLNLSNFDRYYLKFLRYLKTHPNIEIILKPHPLLKLRMTDAKKICEEESLLTEAQYDEFLNEWINLPNGNVTTAGDYYDLFLSSDAMILDSVSFIAEYMPTGKPICFCNRYTSEEELLSHFNQLGNTLFEGLDIARDWDEIEGFIDNVVQGIDSRRSARAELTQKLLQVNKGHVGEFIMRDIKAALAPT